MAVERIGDEETAEVTIQLLTKFQLLHQAIRKQAAKCTAAQPNKVCDDLLTR